MKNTKRLLHVSHKDLDGYGNTLLTEFIVESYPEGMFELETQNIQPTQLYGVLKKILNEIARYDMVIITDLAFTQEMVDLIVAAGREDRFLIFDHHQTNIDVLKYNWITISTNVIGSGPVRKTCATSLYFEFLKTDPVLDIRLLRLPSLEQITLFVDAVTLWDTRSFDYDANEVLQSMDTEDNYWATVCHIAPRLNTLFHSVDKDTFKSYIKDYISDNLIPTKIPVGVGINITSSNARYYYENPEAHSPYLLTFSTENYPWLDKIIEIEEMHNRRYVEAAVKRLNPITLNKDIFKDGKLHHISAIVGLVFAERNGSDIGALANATYPEIDFCAVVSNSQVSFYTAKDDINVGHIAELLGGGGHQKAAGFRIEQHDNNWFNKNHFIAMFNSAGNISTPIRNK